MKLKWRIADTEANLAWKWLYTMGIPAPDVVTYKDHTTRVSRSEGATAKHGYLNVTLFWNRLTRSAGYEIRNLVDGAVSGTGLLYMTVDRADGTNPDADWIDISGRPELSDLSPQAVATSKTVTYPRVQLVLNNITVINDPASF